MDVVSVDRCVARAAKYSIWESKCCLEAIQPDRVSGNGGRERETRTGLKQSIRLPSAGDPSEQTGWPTAAPRLTLRYAEKPAAELRNSSGPTSAVHLPQSKGA